MNQELKLSKNQQKMKDYLESFKKSESDDSYQSRAMKASFENLFMYKGQMYIVDANGCLVNAITKKWRNPFSPDILSSFDCHKASESEILNFINELKGSKNEN